jgi:segregation and condensation protein B
MQHSPDDTAAATAEPHTEKPEPSAEPLCTDQPLHARIEALMLSTERPMAERRLAEILGMPGAGPAIREAIEALNTQYEKTGRVFRLQRLAGGWQILTLPTFGPLVQRLFQERRESKLSQPALETLAIIAYRQPIMRAEIEAIRGVASGEVIRALLERRLIRITGRAEQLGRPMLYGTTPQFLKVFGLPGLDALPTLEGEEISADAVRPADDAQTTETPDAGDQDQSQEAQDQ